MNGAKLAAATVAPEAGSFADGVQMSFGIALPSELVRSTRNDADAWITLTNVSGKGLHLYYTPVTQRLDLDVEDASGRRIAARRYPRVLEIVQGRTFMAPGENQYIPVRLNDWVNITEAGTYYVKERLRLTFSDVAAKTSHDVVLVSPRITISVKQ